MFKVTITCAAAISLTIIIVSCQTTSVQSSKDAGLPEQTRVAIENIKKLLQDSKPLLEAISKNACTAAQGLLSTTLNDSLKKMFFELTEQNRDVLAEIKIPVPVPINNVSLSNSEITLSELRLSNIVLRGLDSAIVNKYVLDICGLYSEAETSVPWLKMTAEYTLNGMVKDFPVTGAGELTLDIDEMDISEITNLACEFEELPEETCQDNRKKTAMDVTIKKATVSMSGVEYKDYDENKINDEINTYISEYITSNRIEMAEILTKMLNEHKEAKFRSMGPLEFLGKLKKDLHRIPASFSKTHRSLRGNAYLSFVSTYYV